MAVVLGVGSGGGYNIAETEPLTQFRGEGIDSLHIDWIQRQGEFTSGRGLYPALNTLTKHGTSLS